MFLKYLHFGVDVMLLKSENDFCLAKLRTICLFDAEFNMNMGRICHSGLGASIAMGNLAHEEYSHPSHSAIDHVVNRKF